MEEQKQGLPAETTEKECPPCQPPSFSIRSLMWLEHFIEAILFHSRWILAPLYLGLVIALLILTVKFGQELLHMVPNVLTDDGSAIILAVLSLVDLVLVTNLLLMIIFSGYENFVSKIDMVTDHVDRPEWMGKIDYTAMKLKVIGSIVAISSIELLKAFIQIKKDNMDDRVIMWMVIIHVVFLLSGVLYAWMEKIYHSVEKH